MFFIKKKRIKRNIPNDLLLELRELQEKKRIEASKPIVRYSISPSSETINRAKEEIKNIKLEPYFKEILFDYIDKKKLTDPEVYKKAMINKRTFSKIRTGEVKHVSRNTAICLGLALELNQKDFDKLLKSNHDHLYNDEYFSIAIKWCIKNKIYNIDQVNDILYACDLDLLTK